MIKNIFLFILGYLLGYLTLFIMLKYREIKEKQDQLETENWQLNKKIESFENKN